MTSSSNFLQKTTILVSGGTGRVGRELVDDLVKRGVAVRIASRRPAKVEPRPGIECVVVDLADPSTLEAAVVGVDAMYLMWPFFSSADQTQTLMEPIAEILGREVPRVVYLSSQTASTQPDSLWATVERCIEGAVREWTMLRPTGFAVNAQMWADQIRRGDVVRWPFGKAKRPLIHERDIAAVATGALLEDTLVGQRPIITGPALISQEEQVAAIGSALGRRLYWQELDRAQAERELDVPAYILDAWQSFLNNPEPVTDEVDRITGKPAHTFARWAHDHIADFS